MVEIYTVSLKIGTNIEKNKNSRLIMSRDHILQLHAHQNDANMTLHFVQMSLHVQMKGPSVHGCLFKIKICLRLFYKPGYVYNFKF